MELLASQLAKINQQGIYGTEEKRKTQLEEIEKLNSRLLDLEKSKADAIKQQKLEQASLNIEKEEEIKKTREIQLEEIVRQRNLRRARAEAASEVRILEQKQKIS